MTRRIAGAFKSTRDYAALTHQTQHPVREGLRVRAGSSSHESWLAREVTSIATLEEYLTTACSACRGAIDNRCRLLENELDKGLAIDRHVPVTSPVRTCSVSSRARNSRSRGQDKHGYQAIHEAGKAGIDALSFQFIASDSPPASAVPCYGFVYLLARWILGGRKVTAP